MVILHGNYPISKMIFARVLNLAIGPPHTVYGMPQKNPIDEAPPLSASDGRPAARDSRDKGLRLTN